MDINWGEKSKKNLIRALRVVESDAEMKAFLRDLLTEEEINDLALRFEVAQQLVEGQSYRAIESETGMSSTTIARISKWLTTGTGGYHAVIEKLHRHTNSQKPAGKELS